MKVFLGHIRCPSCGFTHIVNAKQVTIFFNQDLQHQLVRVVCLKCKQVVAGTIDDQDLYAFKFKGVKVIPWASTLPPLTEAEIDNWDIEEELYGVIG